MSHNRHLPDLAMETLRDMEFEVDAKDDLNRELEHENVCEFGMNVRCKLTSAMHVTKEVGWYRDTSS